ncbi:putative oxidoreductase YcjS [Pseudovibrio axinellae]|uniref:Putative oxidoreductase YcjS n=1 Tax=Pseudovibrio axinellae TaxID=989403 RepID=A0A165Z0J4_9HYPH|nr:Gfo/Idh/MocA family oxidoreductase [Pseudovibrio axinellae]KZL19403.1 putative oxidoreductase YcjS [Pseudovibrio axinellae]SER58973.1 Predicted dehydrogenase [Pseudovibrio axinellae]
MSESLGVGIIGCGNISQTYLELAPLFKFITMRAVADMRPKAAQTRAEEYGLRAQSVNDLLAADDIDIIVNLTIPAAHFEVSKRILEAGKHVYSEKPFVLSVQEGQELARIAQEKGLRIGSAPDTFFGGSHQLARHIIDSDRIGTVHSGTCHVMSNGMESWHPDPDFFFKPGGGPVLDLGPYYITNLVQLLGPVKRVAALTSMAKDVRTITSQPRFGEQITVETPTSVHALLQFENGSTITLGASWDVQHHKHSNMELYGTEGTLYVPDPNFFSGEVSMHGPGGDEVALPIWHHPLGIDNQTDGSAQSQANYRTAGLAEMAQAILSEVPQRCSNELALHVVDVMVSILHSGETGSFIDLATTCTRPEALDAKTAAALMAQPEAVNA